MGGGGVNACVENARFNDIFMDARNIHNPFDFDIEKELFRLLGREEEAGPDHEELEDNRIIIDEDEGDCMYSDQNT